jgi:hypothetical protein
MASIGDLTHLFIGDITISVIEVGLCRGIFDRVLDLQFANLDRTENMRILFNSWKHTLFPLISLGV